MSVLRGNKDSLMAVLEAFVYDPLVDWTPGVELGLAGTYYQVKIASLSFKETTPMLVHL